MLSIDTAVLLAQAGSMFFVKIYRPLSQSQNSKILVLKVYHQNE